MSARLSVRVTKDRTKEVLASMRDLEKRHVVVGVPESEDQRAQDENGDYLNPIGNAALYYIHDNGSPLANIPQRETLRPGIADAQENIAATLGNAAAASFSDPSARDRGLEAAGILASTSVRKRIITSEGLQDLAESTLEDRRERGIESEKPLIRTGSMLNAITYEVREK